MQEIYKEIIQFKKLQMIFMIRETKVSSAILLNCNCKIGKIGFNKERGEIEKKKEKMKKILNIH